jgi:hypothetical protein
MTCIACTSFALKDSPMGKDGLGHCKHIPEPWRTKSIRSTCSKFDQAAQDVVNRREAYVTKGRN